MTLEIRRDFRAARGVREAFRQVPKPGRHPDLEGLSPDATPQSTLLGAKLCARMLDTHRPPLTLQGS